MQQTMEKLMSRYGTDMTIVSGGNETTVRAFFRAVNSKSWQNMERMLPAGGEIPRGQFLYIGPAGIDVLGADYLIVGEKHFVVRRADTILLHDEPLYVWGLCVEGGRICRI